MRAPGALQRYLSEHVAPSVYTSPLAELGTSKQEALFEPFM